MIDVDYCGDCGGPVDGAGGARCSRCVRAQLARKANTEARASRCKGAPLLTQDSTAEEVAGWLQWNDPNGCHTAALARAEGVDPYDTDTAWEALDQMIAD